MLAVLWLLPSVLAFSIGQFRWLVTFAFGYLLLDNLVGALSLSAYATPQYFSGSIHYATGALALFVFPIAWAFATTAPQRIGRSGGWLGTAAALYAVMICGSRGVVVAFVLLVFLGTLAIRRLGGSWFLALLGLAAVFVLLLAIDSAVPGSPAGSSLAERGTLEKQISDTRPHGAFSSRIRYWRQTMEMIRANPLGAGYGTFRPVIHSYQRYPMAWSASAHNGFLELLATGGVISLLALLAVVFIRGRSPADLPWSIATLGFMLPLLFDVFYSFPGYQVWAFAALGTTIPHGATGHAGVTGRLTIGGTVRILGFAAALFLAVWWYWPCQTTTCALIHHGAIEAVVAPLARGGDELARDTALGIARQWNPKSFWVPALASATASSSIENVNLLRELATRFPYQSPLTYTTWARLALSLDRPKEAIDAVDMALRYFDPNTVPFAERRMSAAEYRSWVERALELRAEARLEAWPNTSVRPLP